MSEKNNNPKDWKKFKEEQHEHEEQIFNDDEDEFEPEEPLSALDHPSYMALEEKLSLAEQQVHENWEKSVRALAELDNVRRRAERDVANAHLYGSEKMIKGLLPVMDSLEQALQLADKDANAGMHEGLELTMKLFLDVLEKQGIKQLSPLGEIFNPEEHEAMSMQISAEHPANTILVVFQKGYKLNERVIRPARVIVAKAAS